MEINDFLMSPIQEVKDLANRAKNIEALFESGELTKEEASELFRDLTDLETINKEIVDIEVQRELWQVVNFLKNVKFFASLI